MTPKIARNTIGYTLGVVALLSVGFAGASAFTGSIVLMLLAVLIAIVVSSIAVYKVRNRPDPSSKPYYSPLVRSA